MRSDRRISGVRVEREMRHAPRTTLRVVTQAHLSSTFAVDLHGRAADNQMDWFVVTSDSQLDLVRLSMAAWCRVGADKVSTLCRAGFARIFAAHVR